jgi:hypothetical protein
LAIAGRARSFGLPFPWRARHRWLTITRRTLPCGLSLARRTLTRWLAFARRALTRSLPFARRTRPGRPTFTLGTRTALALTFPARGHRARRPALRRTRCALGWGVGCGWRLYRRR